MCVYISGADTGVASTIHYWYLYWYQCMRCSHVGILQLGQLYVLLVLLKSTYSGTVHFMVCNGWLSLLCKLLRRNGSTVLSLHITNIAITETRAVVYRGRRIMQRLEKQSQSIAEPFDIYGDNLAILFTQFSRLLFTECVTSRLNNYAKSQFHAIGRLQSSRLVV